MPDLRPVLYLDLDDTLLSWASGRPLAVPAAREFVLWALDCFEVRWLTTWCPTGEMEPGLLRDLGKLLDIPPDRLGHIRGGHWEGTDSKLNGISWLEHVVLERPFFWVEDDKGVTERERSFLAEHGLERHYHHCNVTKTPDALSHLHSKLRAELGDELRCAS